MVRASGGSQARLVNPVSSILLYDGRPEPM